MAKKSLLFECQACGYTTPRWMGKCTSCGSWDSLVELSKEQIEHLKSIQSSPSYSNQKATPLDKIKEESFCRFNSGLGELDHMLGGGIVDGSLTLIGGAPGIGKSTLLLKVAGNIATNDTPVLYVSGEESPGQIKLRAERMGIQSDAIYLLGEVDVDLIVNEIKQKPYKLVVIDSIQTLYKSDLPSAPGSVAQVREVTFELMRIAKSLGIAIFIIGHLTKEGSIAGPRILEHMVDTVLYFEGDTHQGLRLLRSFKNRFGTTNEIGIFEMTKEGLIDAKGIGGIFYQQHELKEGAALTIIIEGSRPIVLEIQALVTEAYGHAKRSATGFDNSRLNMLLALLEKKLDLPLGTYDVFVNVTGGIKIDEPAADLAVIAAILSSFKNRPLKAKSIFLGEVTLTGEVRAPTQMLQRLNEAASHGFTHAIVAQTHKDAPKKIKQFEANEVTKIIEWL